MLVHSYLYYWKFDPIVSDDQWQTWANELRDLQQVCPEPIGFYDEDFHGWTGDTGMHLPKDVYVIDKAMYLLRVHDSRGE